MVQTRWQLFGVTTAAIAWSWIGCQAAKNGPGGTAAGGAVATGTATDTSSQSPAGSGDQTASTGTATSNNTGNNTSTSAGSDLADAWPAGIYTGYDGTNSFSVLLPGRNAYKVSDPSIAKITTTTFTITQSLHDSLWAECMKINPNANMDAFDRRFGAHSTRNVYLLTPLKPGTTTLVASKTGGGGAGRNPFGGNMTLVVSGYPATAVATGKARYNNQPAVPRPNHDPCASCHLTGEHGAPSHALGQVERMPDAAVKKWITTGKLPFINLDAQADDGIAHAWQFDSDAEETGIVAYLRTLQATNYEELLTLEFQNDDIGPQLCNFQGGIGVGGRTATAMATATTTATQTH